MRVRERSSGGDSRRRRRSSMACSLPLSGNTDATGRGRPEVRSGFSLLLLGGGPRLFEACSGVVRRALELLQALHVHRASAVELGPVEVEPLAVVVSLGAELVEPDALAVWHAC